MSGNNQGNFWFNILNSSVQVFSGGTASSISGYDIGASGSGYPYNITNSQNGSVGTSTIADNAPLVTTLCGSNLSITGYTYEPGKSISATGSTCFNVTAANVTLNCNGFSITGTNATGTYGIYSTKSNTTIRNCNISNFSEGIRFNGSTDSSAINNNITDSFTNGDGIHLIGGTHRVNLTGNTITDYNADGVDLDSGQNITIDCQGKTLTGNNASLERGLHGRHQCAQQLQRHQLRIRHIDNGTYGGTINNSNSTTSFVNGEAIFLVNTNYTTINNTVANSTVSDGLHLENGSNFNNITA